MSSSDPPNKSSPRPPATTSRCQLRQARLYGDGRVQLHQRGQDVDRLSRPHILQLCPGVPLVLAVVEEDHLGDVVVHLRKVVLVVYLGRDWQAQVHAEQVELVPGRLHVVLADAAVAVGCRHAPRHCQEVQVPVEDHESADGAADAGEGDLQECRGKICMGRRRSGRP
jgi:hypothetical protein